MSYFPMNTPSYNQYDDEDSLLVQAAKRAAQERQMQAQQQYQMPQFDVGGYQPQSNQQETLRKLQAYQQWANAGGQPQQPQNGWSALSKIADAYTRKQMMDNLNQGAPPQQNTPYMNVGEGLPSVLDMLSKYAYGGGD